MANTRLILPSEEYEDELMAVLGEFRDAGERVIPSGLNYGETSFPAMLRATRRFAAGEGLPEGFVPSTTWWLVGDGGRRILGAVNVRHRLNARFLEAAGHVGYGVRPSERRRGHGARLLALGLEKCADLGIGRALLVCDVGNVGSEKIIVKNGGVLEDVRIVDGEAKKRFWVELE